jgi:hypothetical protein
MIATTALLVTVLLPAPAEARADHRRRAVPEFDPAAVGVVAAVITGGALLFARRKKQ